MFSASRAARLSRRQDIQDQIAALNYLKDHRPLGGFCATAVITLAYHSLATDARLLQGEDRQIAATHRLSIKETLVLRERIELSASPLPRELGCANTLLMFKENSLFWRDVPPGFPREAC
jgi:hypothetical protein